MKVGRIEDLAGRISIVAIFTFTSILQLVSVVRTFQMRFEVDNWEIVLASRILGFIFLTLVVLFTFRRLPPKGSAAGLEPRITAIAGTFLLMSLVVLPTGSVTAGWRTLAILLTLAGTLLSIVCLWWLGRSFSIMAAARGLVVQGPYSIVRHPLYMAEAVTSLGIVISNWSVMAVTVGILWFMLQYRRMKNEERILRSTFPEYDSYARRVPMIIPKF